MFESDTTFLTYEAAYRAERLTGHRADDHHHVQSRRRRRGRRGTTPAASTDR